MDSLWRDLRGFVGLSESGVEEEEVQQNSPTSPPATSRKNRSVVEQARGSEFARVGLGNGTKVVERIPSNTLTKGAISFTWALGLLLLALALSHNTIRSRFAVRRMVIDTRLRVERLLNGADAQGWSRCPAKCGWGTQTRQLSSCSPLESRPCWGPGVVGCDGVCNSGTDYDCLHVCGGTAVLDDCGVCDGRNKAKDCAGLCFGNTTTDCTGVCGGAAVVDSCGVCNGLDRDKDCGGCCFGGKKADCAGVCGGTAMPDDCGVCNGRNLDKDCRDICFGTTATDCKGRCGGKASIDSCGVCGYTPTPTDCAGICMGNTPVDCRGVCNGTAVFDKCGVCDGRDRDVGCGGVCFSKLKPDCMGKCGGRAKLDDCGVCNGRNRDKGCDGVCFSGAVETPCGCRIPGDCGSCGCPAVQRHVIPTCDKPGC